ncbi:MAG: adenylate/guanylate cyclase domain-containing protein [Candidatus Zixiibacteriota bacterium]|jgi:class 3 adenylate cyclase
MDAKRPKTLYWLWGLGAFGIAVTAAATVLDPPSLRLEMAAPIAVFAAAAFLSGIYQVRLTSASVFSLCAAAFAGAVLAFGPVIGAWLAAGVDLLITVADQRRIKRGLAAPAPADIAPGRVVINTGLNALMFLAGGYAYRAVAGEMPVSEITPLTVAGIVAFLAARMVVIQVYHAIIGAVRGTLSIRSALRDIRSTLTFDVALYPAALVLALLYAHGMLWGLALAGTSLVLASVLLQRQTRLDLVVKRYVSPAKSSEILDNPYEFLRAERRDISIVFADLRGTTGISQRLPAADMLALLNAFHRTMIDEVIRAGATVDKIMGDGLMILVGAPIREENHPAKAVELGIALQRAYRGVRRDLEGRGLPAPGMGVGVATGEVVIGNVGSEMRLDYTAIGAAVNVSSKLCAAAADTEILITGECRRRVEEAMAAGRASYLKDIEFEGLAPLAVAGLAEPIEAVRAVYA